MPHALVAQGQTNWRMLTYEVVSGGAQEVSARWHHDGPACAQQIPRHWGHEHVPALLRRVPVPSCLPYESGKEVLALVVGGGVSRSVGGGGGYESTTFVWCSLLYCSVTVCYESDTAAGVHIFFYYWINKINQFKRVGGWYSSQSNCVCMSWTLRY